MRRALIISGPIPQLRNITRNSWESLFESLGFDRNERGGMVRETGRGGSRDCGPAHPFLYRRRGRAGGRRRLIRGAKRRNPGGGRGVGLRQERDCIVDLA